MEQLTKFISESKIIIATLITISTFSISTYKVYTNILDDIKYNATQLELTQMMILKPLVRIAEDNKNKVSDAEWDEYIY